MDAFVRNLFLGVIALTFFMLAATLMVRFVYLSLLLILLPLAWLCWIFPGTKQYFDMWWKKFIQWTIFAPLAVFFLYLALLTSNTMSQSAATQASQPGVVAGTAAGTAAALTGKSEQADSFSKTIGQILLLSGLALGGLIAAQSLSITGAGAAMGIGKGIGKGFAGGLGGWAARKPAGLAARLAQRAATAAPPKQYTGWRSFVNPINRGTAWLRQQTLGRALGPASRTGVGRRLIGALGTFGTKAQKSPGLLKSVGLGVAYGSGLLKKKAKRKDWECQVCGNVISSTKKPTAACASCGSPTATANWKEV